MRAPWLLTAVWLLALPAGAEPVRVADDVGREVQLAQPAGRIVSLAPHLTELLYAAGAGERIVATVEYSDYPAAARRIERVGDSARLNLERIVALRPDLVVVWHDGSAAQQIDKLVRLGLPVFAGRTDTLADIGATLRKLGTLAGTAAAAEARAVAYEDRLRTLQAHYAGRHDLRVFYQIWPQPLMTVNGRHPISQALALCGARNLFAEQKALTPTVEHEAVVSADPDAIVTGRAPQESGDSLQRWRRLSAMRAVRSGALISVDADTLHRQSDRIAQGIEELCARLDAVRQAQPAGR